MHLFIHITSMVDDDHHEIMDPHAEPLHKKQLAKEQEDSSMDFLCPARRTFTIQSFACVVVAILEPIFTSKDN